MEITERRKELVVDIVESELVNVCPYHLAVCISEMESEEFVALERSAFIAIETANAESMLTALIEAGVEKPHSTNYEHTLA